MCHLCQFFHHITFCEKDKNDELFSLNLTYEQQQISQQNLKGQSHEILVEVFTPCA
jgi:hypothetical protein